MLSARCTPPTRSWTIRSPPAVDRQAALSGVADCSPRSQASPMDLARRRPALPGPRWGRTCGWWSRDDGRSSVGRPSIGGTAADVLDPPDEHKLTPWCQTGREYSEAMRAPITLDLHLPNFNYPAGADRLFEKLVEIATTAEGSGFSSISLMDHLHQIAVWGPRRTGCSRARRCSPASRRGPSKATLGLIVGGVPTETPRSREDHDDARHHLRWSRLARDRRRLVRG